MRNNNKLELKVLMIEYTVDSCIFLSLQYGKKLIE